MAAAVEGPELEAAAAAGDASEDTDAGARALPFLGGNRLSLDLYPGGCQRLLHLCVQQPLQLLRVEFLRLGTHEDPQLLEATLAQLPQSLSCLRSLVLKGSIWDLALRATSASPLPRRATPGHTGCLSPGCPDHPARWSEWLGPSGPPGPELQ